MGVSVWSESIWFAGCESDERRDTDMKKGPRRTRAQAWVAVYCRLFGPSEADSSDGEEDPNEYKCENETDGDENHA